MNGKDTSINTKSLANIYYYVNNTLLVHLFLHAKLTGKILNKITLKKHLYSFDYMLINCHFFALYPLSYKLISLLTTALTIFESNSNYKIILLQLRKCSLSFFIMDS